MKDIWETLKNTEKPILIYGMGDGCDKILSVCQEKGIPIAGIFASDDYVRKKTVHGFSLMGYTEAKRNFPEMIALLAFGVFRPELMAQIKTIASEIELFAPEVPLFGGGLFDSGYFEAHKKELSEVEEMLSDELSKKIFKNLIEYKLTGKIEPLLDSQTEKIEDYKALIPYRKGDVYLDLGAYNGDTVLEWDALFPDHGEIYAVEPNQKTFQKLMENCREISGFHGIEGAVWNKSEPLSFNTKSGRSAAIEENGAALVKGIRADEICPKADFIKFDVEGAEKEAIEGAEGLIQSCAPTLCISAYHRTEDLFAIPLQVKKIFPKYRVYLRHSPYIPAWDTQFYFVGRE